MIVKTYKKLEVFLDRWVSGAIDLLIIESNSGLGKTNLIREKLKGVSHLAINSHITPLQNYKTLFENRDKLVWFDDVYFLLVNQLNVTLLKQLCETTSVKKLAYYTTSEAIGCVPMSFNTTSRVLISCNSVEGNDVHIQAIKDRGFHIRFEPTREELLSKMREISINYPSLADSEKEEVMSLIEYNSKHCKNFSLRSLIKGFQLYQYYKLKGEGWETDLLEELGLNDKLVRMNELLAKHSSDMERLKHWDWSRQTFYTYKALAEASYAEV